MYSREFLLGLSSHTALPIRKVRRKAFFFNILDLDSIRKTKKILKSKLKAKSNDSFKINSLCNSINPSNHNLLNILSNSNTTSNANLNLESGLNSNSNTNDDLNLINNNISNANPNSVFNINFLPNKLKYLKNNNLSTNNNINNHLNIGLLNIRSINSKSLYISDLISSNSLDLFAVTETWHESASSPSLITAAPKGFSFLESARPPLDPLSSRHSCYGGICLFYRSLFSVSVDSSSFHFDTFECLFTAFKFNSFNFNLVILYRPPSSSLPHFLDDFHQLCESLYSLSLPFYILGDFNIPINSYVLKFLDILSTFNLTQHCNFPTYRLGNTLDFFISSSYSKISNLFSEPVHYSDHHFISLKLHFTTPPCSQFLNIVKRSWSSFDISKFCSQFNSLAFPSDSFTDVDAFLTAFNFAVSSILDSLAPYKTFTYRLSSKKAPWFDHDCILSKRLSRKHERFYRSSPSLLSFTTWKNSLYVYRTLLYTKHSSYLRQSIVSFSSSKNRWSSLSKLLHKNSSPPSFSPDDYLNYISDKINSIRSLNNNNNNLPTFTKLATDSLSSFSCLSISDLTEIINSMSSTTCHLDILPTNLFKNLSSILYPIVLN